MSARLLAFVIWAAVAASAVFWLLRLSASSPVAPAHTVAVTATAPRGDLMRVLGAPPVRASAATTTIEPSLASRFKLIGVAAPREGGDRSGLALIAVDGKPARSFKVGAAVDGEIVLRSVHPRGAALGTRDAAAPLQLELPALPPPNMGTRPAFSTGLVAVPPGPPGAVPLPGSGPIATLPPPVQGVPPATETQEPVPVPPPPQAGNINTR